MLRVGTVRVVVFLFLLAAAGAVSAGDAPPDAKLLRYPDIHEDFVVFVYGGDIWRAPAQGGEGRRLTAHEGLELFPKISPDGRWVAYTAEYTGSRQVFIMPSAGGEPRQLTFYTDVGRMPPRGGWDYWVLGFSPDGKILVRMNRTPWGPRMGRYYLVDPAGGLETALPLPQGGGASLSPDGSRLAYCPISREFRTWKRTRGGRAQEIWIYDFEARRSERITEFPGTDNFPMWADETIFFTSDRSETLNLFAYDLRTRRVRQVTEFDVWDVLWPSLGPGAIVFMKGGELWRLDLDTEQARHVPIRIGSDLPFVVPHFKDVSGNVVGAGLSPSGKRAVFEARGELFTVPAKHGPTRNLTRTQGVREMDPAWSPDGESIAYLSDATGEYEIYVRPQDGSGEPRRLTRDGDVWRFPPVWSPDSKLLAFGDRKRRLRILDVQTGAITEVDRGDQGDLDHYTWSPDSRWLAYEKPHRTRLPGIAVYAVGRGAVYMLGDGLTMDFQPVFGADGKHLFFLSNRDYQIRFSDFEFDYLYDRATRIYAAALNPDVPALFGPRSDEEEGPKEAEDDDKGSKKEPVEGKKRKNGGKAEKEQPEPVRIDPVDFVLRTVALPGLKPGDYASLATTKGALFYLGRDNGSDLHLHRYDLEERKPERVLDKVQGYELSADGEKILYRIGDDFGIVDARPNQKPDDGKLNLSSLRVKVDPRSEWRQMFDDAWRIGRDWFYDPEMHGVDWRGLRERYGGLVEHVAHRTDLDFVFGEMISELEAGHTYVSSGDEPTVERVRGGMLGCEFETDASGRFRIAKIFAGENWNDSFRSPLTEPGINVREGDFLLAIDGVELRAPDNPYRALEGKADEPVVLDVNDRPSLEGARKSTVRPVASETLLRYLDWVKSRMALVDRLSEGRIGYIHLPDTSVSGNRMLQKLFYGQANKEALIIDDRYNGGGFIPDRMIEYFSRTTIAYWARRGAQSMRTPNFAHDGPKVMLINAYSSSGGDALPYFFREKGLGKLIGTRTWGGLIGLTGTPSLVDGGTVLYPTFRIYDTDGSWVIENEGVSPDIEVHDLPELVIAGGDPSVEKAVEVLLEELRRGPVARPGPPGPPDMRR